MTEASLSPQEPEASLPGRCKARTKRGPCKAWPVRGAVVCVTHGGATKRVKDAAARRLAEQKAEKQAAKARQAVAKLGVVEPVVDPLTALSELAGEILAVKNFLRAEVDRLEGLKVRGAAGELLRVEVAAYERALDRSVTALAAIARLNIDERLARITVAQKTMVIRALEAGLTAAGVSGERAIEARTVIAQHLRQAEETAR